VRDILNKTLAAVVSVELILGGALGMSGLKNIFHGAHYLYKVPWVVVAVTYTLPFKSLGSLRNVLVFERKACFLSIKITPN
jgi:hypothetical protein